MNGKCQKIANRLSVNKNVHFLGRRNDIPELLKISNLAVSSSKREGLPINVIESQLCGLPIVAYKCRGCSEIINNKTGKIIRNKNDFINAIEYYYERRHRIVNKDIDRYFIKNILKKMKKIYRV